MRAQNFMFITMHLAVPGVTGAGLCKVQHLKEQGIFRRKTLMPAQYKPGWLPLILHGCIIQDPP